VDQWIAVGRVFDGTAAEDLALADLTPEDVAMRHPDMGETVGYLVANNDLSVDQAVKLIKGTVKEVTSETIKFEKFGPGKFDDNVQEALYEIVLEGGADAFLGEADTFGAYDLLLLGDDPLIVQHEDGSEEVIGAAILLTTYQGFVYTNQYETEEEARVDWEKVEEDYDEWLGESEEAY
jgi:hypothetical protein